MSLPALPAARVLAALTLVLALAATACGSGREASGDVRAGTAPEGAVEVIAVDNEFQPAQLRVAPGEVTLAVANQGQSAHNLVIDQLGLSTGTIQPGESVTATFTAAGEPLDYVCTFHPGMEGRIDPTG